VAFCLLEAFPEKTPFSGPVSKAEFVVAILSRPLCEWSCSKPAPKTKRRNRCILLAYRMSQALLRHATPFFVGHDSSKS
jgi:hypothetical protein